MVDQTETRVDTLFTALGDRTRRGFLRRLSRSDATISELAEPEPMSLQAVSKHLRVLEEAGLVQIHKRGRERHVSLDARPLRDLAEWVAFYRAFWEDKLDALAAYVEGSTPPSPAEKPSKPSTPRNRAPRTTTRNPEHEHRNRARRRR